MTTAAFIAAWASVVAVLVAWHLDNQRHAALLQDVLERISTEPRIEFRAAAPTVVAANTRKYIADHVADDEAWNDFRGEPQEDPE